MTDFIKYGILKGKSRTGGDKIYEVTVLNLETGETFREPFKSLYFLEQFKRKCKYSKKLRIIAISKIY